MLYTYASLFSQLQAWPNEDNDDYLAALPDIIAKGELRIWRDLDLDLFDYQVPTLITTITGIAQKPTNLIRDRVVVLQDLFGANLDIISQRGYEWITEYNISAGVVTGRPKYYCESDESNWQVAPLPDDDYRLSVRGIYRPALLADNPTDTDLAGLAAFQHMTSATPLTLTVSPYTFPSSRPVALTSVSNLSAISFTVVGLDDSLAPLSQTISGPNANTVQTGNVFSKVISITPNTTDGVNFIEAGWLQANVNWISTRFPDMLFESCLIDACEFLKRYSAKTISEGVYKSKLAQVLAMVRTMKRSDIDDIVGGRMVQNIVPIQNEGT